MNILQVALALVFITVMIATKNKRVILTGWVLVFTSGALLYYTLYSSEAGGVDVCIVLASVMASVRNFFVNNDFASYADKTDSAMLLSLNIVYLLSVFMTLLTTARIMVAYFSDNLYLFLYGMRRHICVFTDDSANTIRLTRSVKDCVNNPLCVFIGCGRVSEFEPEKDILFLKDSVRLKKYDAEVFICSEDMKENNKTYEKLRTQLPKAKFYVFSDSDTCSLNNDALLVRYLFTSNKFVPKSFIGDKQARICIVGDNNLAVELCKEMIVQCQSVKGIPQITVIGAHAEDNFAFFVKSNPELNNCAELIFVNENPMSVAGINALTGGEYHLYLFCDANKKLSKLVPPEKVVEIPEYKVIYDYNIIVNHSLDKEAKELNAEYVRHCQGCDNGAIVDADAEWRKLPEFHRQSNRSQAINSLSKKHLYSLGVSIDQLSEEEHMRWSAFHYVNGWIYGKNAEGKKDFDKKIHPCLVPYDELPSSDKVKDIMFVKKTLGEEVPE